MAESGERKEISVGAVLIGSAALALAVGLVTAAFQIAGIVNMAMAHLLMAFAWLVAVVSICLIESHVYTTKVRLISVVIVSVILGGLDFWMVKKRAEIDMANASKGPPHSEPTTLGKYVCTTDLPAKDGKRALLVEFGVRRGQTNGFAGEVHFTAPYARREAWVGAPLRTDKQGGMLMQTDVTTWDDPSHLSYAEKFMSPVLTPRVSYYLYFEAEQHVQLKSLFFIEDPFVLSDQVRREILAKQVDACPR